VRSDGRSGSRKFVADVLDSPGGRLLTRAATLAP
jgi:hypothetical protein